MRVAIVNDLPLAVEILRRTLALDPAHQLAWVAKDGAEAVRMCAADTPDVVLMDLIMPVMDGVAATREIMRKTPCAILVVTATVEGNAAKVFEAMGQGALDAVSTPVLGSGGRIEGAPELLDKIALLGRLLARPGDKAAEAPARHAPAAARLPFIALGASTGGPAVLAQLLAGLPADCPAAVLVVQHVDARFASGLADWLGASCRLPVTVAAEGQAPAAGRVLVAATDDHLVLGPDRTLHYTPEPRDCPYRPSVDALFESLAAYAPAPGLAALLTGMGRDGARGLLALRRAGWRTLAQDQASCVVYGMPKAAAEYGAAEAMLAPADLARELARFCQTERRST